MDYKYQAEVQSHKDPEASDELEVLLEQYSGEVGPSITLDGINYFAVGFHYLQERNAYVKDARKLKGVTVQKIPNNSYGPQMDS